MMCSHATMAAGRGCWEAKEGSDAAIIARTLYIHSRQQHERRALV